MPPRRRQGPARATPPIDVEDLRSRLDQAKIVRVAIAPSAQFPQGSVGRVRRIGDPEIEGEEYIHVELTVGGTKDLLPFAPADLRTPSRAAAAPAPGPTAVAPPTAPESGPRPPPSEPLQITDTRTVGAPGVPDGSPVDAPPRPRPTRPRATTRRRGPAVSISIGTTDNEPPQWRIEARVGSKVVLRNSSVPPARVWELVGMLGDQTLTRAVGGVLDEQRHAAQSRADALAAELAKVQAELAELPEPDPTTGPA